MLSVIPLDSVGSVSLPPSPWKVLYQAERSSQSSSSSRLSMGIYTYTALLLSLTTLTFSFLLSLPRKKKLQGQDGLHVSFHYVSWLVPHPREEGERGYRRLSAAAGRWTHAGGSSLCFLWPQQTTSAKHWAKQAAYQGNIKDSSSFLLWQSKYASLFTHYLGLENKNVSQIVDLFKQSNSETD